MFKQWIGAMQIKNLNMNEKCIDQRHAKKKSISITVKSTGCEFL
jgi:hypothetical protein